MKLDILPKMAEVRLTHAADQDLEYIFEFTVQRFGLSRARRYQAEFQSAFDILRRYPLAGSDQGDIQPGLRRLVHQHHSLYYRLETDTVVVARILGPGQDPIMELPISWL